MKELAGKVAVVTGAASGIGRALVDRFLAEGMKVVAADRANVDEKANLVYVRTDVSRAADIEQLVARTRDAFGTAHIVCNNAGIGAGGPFPDASLEQWERVLAVNLWSVIYGCRAFLPLLTAQNEGHIVNTASMAGLTSNPFMSAYNVSKHGVVALSETLYQELSIAQSKVHISVLCPGWVRTAIADGAPGPLGDMMRAQIATGIAPEQVADEVVRAIREERFYILTHPHFLKATRIRMEDILAGRNPTLTFKF